jgi:hypothetical protein
VNTLGNLSLFIHFNFGNKIVLIPNSANKNLSFIYRVLFLILDIFILLYTCLISEDLYLSV